MAVLVVTACTNGREAYSHDAPTTGTVKGTVTYRADSQRPWRLGRYYIRDRKAGHLAEAVVALKGPSLRRRATTGKPATTLVDQKNFRFTPETVVIRRGDRVKFTNSDLELHNVNSTSLLHRFNVSIPIDGHATQTFDRATGIRRPVPLGCAFHGAMRAWVFVFDHAHFQLTGDDGRFLLEAVPPGDYQLEMSHPAGQLRASEPVTVKAGETLSIEIAVSPDDKESY